MDLGVVAILELLAIGLAAGLLGGLLGIGGSVVMLPALAILFAGREWGGQHLWQASAMLVNVAIAVPSALGHRKKGSFRRDVFVKVLPATGVAIVVGVLVSNMLSGGRLQQVLAVFLGYVCVMMVFKAVRGMPDHEEADSRVTWVRGSVVGGVMGFMAGLLGIGGAVIATPLMQLLCRSPIRIAIAVSAAVMCFTSPVGAALKVGSLGEHGHAWWEALVLFGILAPTAIVGARIGARVSHRLPLQPLRLVFAVVLGVAAVRLWMAGASGVGVGVGEGGDVAGAGGEAAHVEQAS